MVCSSARFRMAARFYGRSISLEELHIHSRVGRSAVTTLSMVRILLLLLLCYCSSGPVAQPLVQFDSTHATARVQYNKFLHRIFSKQYERHQKFPVVGAYSPTAFTIKGVKSGVGVCNYIFIPTHEKFTPGHQYSLTLTVKLPKTYEQMPYFQRHFGIALSSDIYTDEYGLWPKHFIPLDIPVADELVNISIEFRPLCTSKYIVLGVFQSMEKDNQACFACPHTFELHSLIVNESSNTEGDFYYICDGFEEDALSRIHQYGIDTDTVYFELGSTQIEDRYNEILDSIPVKLRTSQDLVSLYAYTDLIGDNNDSLGFERNQAIRDALIARGVDSMRICLVNYGENKSSHYLSGTERKVEIDINSGKLFQKYYTSALEAARDSNYSLANEMIKKWLEIVPPELSIYALFDCWGEGVKAVLFQNDLYKRVKSKHYRANSLRFKLDSLSCEHHRMDGLNLAANHLPTYQNACSQMYNDTKASIQELAEALYSSHGFPLKEEVGLRANRAIPDIMVSNTDHVYLQEQLPLIREACEQEQIPWDYYALLFDKIHVFRNGYQRYGTQKFSEEKGSVKFRAPVEDIEMLNEYRKQVKLAPFTADVINETRIRQEHLDSSLIFILNQIYQDDQKYRGKMRGVEENSESKTSQQSEQWSAMARTDSINSTKISILLDSLGWLGPETIGYHGVDAVFLVIQHADLETQLAYLPMLHDAVMHHQLDASNLAMLEDRISVKQGKEQIYGTQIGMDSGTGKYYVLPLIEPEKVNERRQRVNLGRIEEYVKRWNITWSID